MTDDLAGFNPLAEEAINWTRKQLTDEDKQWLRELKMVRQVRDFTIVHATLDTPHKWGYVFNQLDAAASFNYQHTQLCFYGHTHAPRAYIRDGSVKSQVARQAARSSRAKNISSTSAASASRAMATGTPPTASTTPTSSSSNCAASNTTSGPRRIRSSTPACRSGSRTGWRWESSARAASRAACDSRERPHATSGHDQETQPAPNILVIKPSSLGDVVHTLPAVALSSGAGRRRDCAG